MAPATVKPGATGRAWRWNALLAAAVVALGAFVYLRPGEQLPAEYSLAAIRPSDIESIRIERAGVPAMVLEKQGDAWRMTAPLVARADAARVQRVLEIAGARAAHRFPVTDLARYELDPPQVRLMLGSARFDFGLVNTLSSEQYVRAGDAVYPVGLRYAAALPAKAEDLLDRRLLGTGEVPVRIAPPGFAVSRVDGKWTLEPAGAELSQDDYQPWVEGWRQAAAVRVAPYAPGKPPLERVAIALQSGTSLTLQILAREPELALLRPDENLVYHFLASQAKRLLAPPTARDEPERKK